MPKNRQDRSLGKNYIHQKRVLRLIFNKDLTERDYFCINQIYEQKQHENFYYAFCLPPVLGVAASALFKIKPVTRYTVIGGLSVVFYMFFHVRANLHYEAQIRPYFEKYQIK